MIAVWALSLSACTASPPAPDTVLFNGRIFTANPAQPWADALAIRGDRIVAAGDAASLMAAAGASTTRIDLGGRAVVPGFNDASLVLSAPTIESVRLLAADAVAHGVTSVQVFSRSPVSDTVAVFRAADLPLRVRISRMPEPDAAGVSRDSRPYFPPQPGPRLDVRGMGFELAAGDDARVRQAVGWAYGSEDPLAIRGLDPQAIEALLAALEGHGTADVWKAKRPRLVQPASLPAGAGDRLRRLGVVVVQSPREGVPLKSILTGGVPLALGSGPSPPGGPEMIAAATSPLLGAEALTREEAVTAYTRGSAQAEASDKDKGHLSVGALADLVVLSGDLFGAGAEDVAKMSSVLTMIGGRPVHNVLRP